MIDLLAFGLVWGVSISFIAIALGTAWRILGMLDFGLAGIYGLVGYALLTIHNFCGAPVWLAVALSLALGPLAQVLVYLVVYRPFIHQQKPLAALVLLGLSVLYICQNATALIFGSGGQLVLTSQPGNWTIGTVDLSTVDLLSLAALGLAVASLLLLLRYTGIGLAVRAVASNPVLAQVFGINLEVVRLVLFALMGLLTAIPAVLSALYDPITPTGGFNPLLFGFAALVMASVRSGIGVLQHALSGIGLGVLTGMSLIAIPSQWQLAVPFVAMLIVSSVRKTRNAPRSV